MFKGTYYLHITLFEFCADGGVCRFEESQKFVSKTDVNYEELRLLPKVETN